MAPLDDLLGLIHDAPLDGDWTAALRAMEPHFACGHVVLIRQGLPGGAPVATGSNHHELDARYAAQYAPLNRAWPRLMRHTVGEPVTDAMVLDMEEHRGSVFFNEFLRPNDLVHAAGCVLLRTPTLAAGLALSRPARGAAFEAGEIDALRVLAPHLARSLRLEARLAEARDAADGAWELIERLRGGVLVVDARGRLLRANQVAEAVLRLDDGLALRGGQVVAGGAAGARLALAIARRTDPRAAPGPDELLRLDRPSGRPPFLLDVLPLQGPPGWTGTGRSCCAVFVTDLDAAPSRAGAVLRRTFGLTAAEAALALQLGSGEGLSGIAVRLGVGLATARTHLAGALGRTGLHRQAELVRLVERLGGALHGEAPPPNG